MTEQFDFNPESSWRAVGAALSAVTGYDMVPHDSFVAAWRDAKQRFVELLGPTGRVEVTITNEPSTDEIQDVLMDYLYMLPPATQCVLNDLRDEQNGLKLSDVPNNALSEPLPDPRPGREGKLVQKGTKLTKYLDMLAESRGLDKKAREKLAVVMSRVISRLKPKEYTICLSVNPLDMLLVSEHTAGGWRSCHRLDGEFRAGPLAYMQDRVTAVAYAYAEGDWDLCTVAGLTLPRKAWRQMVYFDFEHRSALCMREYPDEKPVLAAAVRRLVASVLMTADNAAEHRWTVRYLRGASGSASEDDDSSTEHYEIRRRGGYFYLDSPTAWVRLPGGDPPRVDVGVESLVCPKCGHRRDDSATDKLLCSECLGYKLYYCASCGTGLHEDDVYRGPDGELYCEDCARDSFTYCFICGDAVWLDYVLTGTDDYPYCESCWSAYFVACSQCECTLQKEYANYDVRGEAYCDDCLAEYTWVCNLCNDRYPDTNAPYEAYDEDLNELLVCGDCLARRCARCADCEDYFIAWVLVCERCPGCREEAEEECGTASA